MAQLRNTFLIIIVKALFISGLHAQNVNDCITGDGIDERDLEISVGYYQVNKGFLFADLTASFDVGYGIGFYEPGIRAGYNPWTDCLLFQTTQGLFIGLFALECYAGWVQNLDLNRGGILYCSWR